MENSKAEQCFDILVNVGLKQLPICGVANTKSVFCGAMTELILMYFDITKIEAEIVAVKVYEECLLKISNKTHEN